MQKLAEICIRRPVFASMIVLSLVVVGTAGFFKLGVDRFPSVDVPTVSVRVGLPGAAPEEVESLVTQPLEEVINTVDGISELRSVSGQGSGFVIATFKLDRNLESAAQDVRDRVNSLGRRLPEDATPERLALADPFVGGAHRVVGLDRPAVVPGVGLVPVGGGLVVQLGQLAHDTAVVGRAALHRAVVLRRAHGWATFVMPRPSRPGPS